MAFREPPYIRSLEKEAETGDCGVILTYAGTLVLIIQTDLAFVDLGYSEKSQRSDAIYEFTVGRYLAW